MLIQLLPYYLSYRLSSSSSSLVHFFSWASLLRLIEIHVGFSVLFLFPYPIRPIFLSFIYFISSSLYYRFGLSVLFVGVCLFSSLYLSPFIYISSSYTYIYTTAPRFVPLSFFPHPSILVWSARSLYVFFPLFLDYHFRNVAMDILACLLGWLVSVEFGYKKKKKSKKNLFEKKKKMLI
ncbi:hypothetical protein Pst134EA_017618 [Puccinia striiformis f. sp. tritici]|nr:hypothetical protein Pst134EA_017618 [Puccinia striiformis f. sp. tritici]KAH9461310.1 hypothetical protein Pst134EA_017618 [Puccinia striiformis f. sp. tritici]